MYIMNRCMRHVYGRMIRYNRGMRYIAIGTIIYATYNNNRVVLDSGEEGKTDSMTIKQDNFKRYLNKDTIGADIDDFGKILEGGADFDYTQDYLIVINPHIYNDNFLEEIQGAVSDNISTNQNIRLFYIDTHSLLPESQAKLEEIITGSKIPEETLFLIKRANQKKFDFLTFDTYFQNSKFLLNYFESLKTITDKNKEVFMKYVSTGLKPDQLFVIGLLDTSSPDIRDKMITKLRNVKLENPALNSESIGIVGGEADLSSWLTGGVAGDVVLVQSADRSRVVSEGTIDKTSHLVSVVKGGVWMDSEALGREIAEAYYRSNPFYHKDMIESSSALYHVKVRIDANKQTKKLERELHEKVNQIRARLRETDAAFGDKVVFTLEKTRMKDEQPEVLVSDLRRLDLRTM